MKNMCLNINASHSHQMLTNYPKHVSLLEIKYVLRSPPPPGLDI